MNVSNFQCHLKVNHPIAKAIRDYEEQAEDYVIDIESWDYRVGRGVCAQVNGQTVLLGNSKLLEEENVEIPSFESDPKLLVATPIYLSVNGRLASIHYALDQVRPDTADMIAELHRRGIEAHMLTGDIAPVAHAVAKDIGLKPEEVHSDALPDQKAELVQHFTAQGKKVVFVGDGINDSAALAYADVSVSFASGSDLARETADIVLTNDRVSDLIVAQDLARHTFALVKQNIGIVGVPILWHWYFLPVIPLPLFFSTTARVWSQRPMPFEHSVSNKGESSCRLKSPPRRNQTRLLMHRGVTQVVAESISWFVPPLKVTELSERVGVFKFQPVVARRFQLWIAERPDGFQWTCKDSNLYNVMAA